MPDSANALPTHLQAHEERQRRQPLGELPRGRCAGPAPDRHGDAVAEVDEAVDCVGAELDRGCRLGADLLALPLAAALLLLTGGRLMPACSLPGA